MINRQIKKVILLFVFILMNLLFVAIASKLYFEFNSGADRSTALHIELKNNDYYLPSISIQTTHLKGKSLNNEILKKIKKDYLNAWYVKQYALKNNDTESFRDFYTDSAQVKLTELIQHNIQAKTSIQSTSLKHNLEFQYFSEDGQLVFMKDTNVEEISEVLQNGTSLYKEQSISNYDVVLLLEDGFWRIRHMIKTKHQENNTFKINHSIPTKFMIKGINYYPQKSPWNDFWNTYNASIVDRDFKKIKKLKLNTVRIFIPYESFGKAMVSDEKIKYLKQTLDLAQKNELKVILTLFDFYGDYSITDFTLCDRHLEQIVNTVKNHNALLQYDIKNEPDLDFKNYSKSKVLNWLSFIAERIKKYDHKTPVTIGWYSPEKAHLLEKKIDIVSFHYYKKPSKFNGVFQNLRMKTKKPIVVQEYGKHSYNSFWFPFSNTELKQAIYYKELQEQFKLIEDLNFLSWTLYDFPNIDSSIFGHFPHKINPQKNYGIINIEGKYKEASKFITNSNAKIKTSSLLHINKFNVSLLIISLLVLILIVLKYTYWFRN